MSTVTGDKIKQIRTNRRLTQEAFGKVIGGVDKRLVSKWERGVARPDDTAAQAIARLGFMTVEDLLEK